MKFDGNLERHAPIRLRHFSIARAGDKRTVADIDVSEKNKTTTRKRLYFISFCLFLEDSP